MNPTWTSERVFTCTTIDEDDPKPTPESDTVLYDVAITRSAGRLTFAGDVPEIVADEV